MMDIHSGQRTKSGLPFCGKRRQILIEGVEPSGLTDRIHKDTLHYWLSTVTILSVLYTCVGFLTSNLKLLSFSYFLDFLQPTIS